MKNNKTRHICDLTFCRHINTEKICTIGNQENCVYYKKVMDLKSENLALDRAYTELHKQYEEVKANADYQLEGRDVTIKELEAQLKAISLKIIYCIKSNLCKQDEDYDKPIISPKFLSDTLDQMAIDGFEKEIKENDR